MIQIEDRRQTKGERVIDSAQIPAGTVFLGYSQGGLPKIYLKLAIGMIVLSDIYMVVRSPERIYDYQPVKTRLIIERED